MLTNEDIENYINNLDIKLNEKKSLRHTDHKIQPDVIETISEIILNYCEKEKTFTNSEIRNHPDSYRAFNEFFEKKHWSPKEVDKLFSQPNDFLSFYKVLSVNKCKNKKTYAILRKDILEYLANHPRNSYFFIASAHKKFLDDNKELKIHYDRFFENQDEDHFSLLKENHGKFLEKYTGVKDKAHKNRIFIPFTNILAFNKKKQGTRKGYLSKTVISWDEILYNQPNWFDKLTKKEKNIGRADWYDQYIDQISEQKSLSNEEEKAKEKVRNYHESKSEYGGDLAKDIHHIFPRRGHTKHLRAYRENLFNVTPNEHWRAHPNGTRSIDKTFQAELLLKKLSSIHSSIDKNDNFYNLKFFIEVLNEGYKSNLSNNSTLKEIKSFLEDKLNEFKT